MRERLTPGLVITIEPTISAGGGALAAGRRRLDRPHAGRLADRTRRAHRRRDALRIAAGAHVGELRSQHPGARGVVVDRVNEQLTRREALVAALAATTLGGGALLRPGAAHAQRRAANIGVILPLSSSGDQVAGANVLKVAKLWAVLGQRPRRCRRPARHAQDLRRQGPRRARRPRPSRERSPSDNCSVILAGWDSGVALAEIEEAHRLGVPFFVSYAWSPDVTRAGYPEVVRIGPNSDMLTSAFLPFMIKRNYTRVALIAEDTAYGQGLGETIRAKRDARRHRRRRARLRARLARPAPRAQAPARAQAARRCWSSPR